MRVKLYLGYGWYMTPANSAYLFPEDHVWPATIACLARETTWGVLIDDFLFATKYTLYRKFQLAAEWPN